MGFELWYSKTTGIRRKGTSFEELQGIFDKYVTTKFIYEPLACCKIQDIPFEVKRTLDERDFDVLGVIDSNEEKIGFIEKDSLIEESIEKQVIPFSVEQIISESTSLIKLFKILLDKNFVFVLKNEKIEGIVTKADINKPIVRIYLFGIISLLEMHLNYWISHYYPDESWQALISNSRLNKVLSIFKLRKGKNLELGLLECMQLCDKRNILSSTEFFCSKFNYQPDHVVQFLEHVEILRNELAHSQNSIIDNMSWSELVTTISKIEYFLRDSEQFLQNQEN